MQNPSKIRRLDCSFLAYFSEILKIISEYIYIFFLESLELQLSVPAIERKAIYLKAVSVYSLKFKKPWRYKSP